MILVDIPFSIFRELACYRYERSESRKGIWIAIERHMFGNDVFMVMVSVDANSEVTTGWMREKHAFA